MESRAFTFILAFGTFVTSGLSGDALSPMEITLKSFPLDSRCTPGILNMNKIVSLENLSKDPQRTEATVRVEVVFCITVARE